MYPIGINQKTIRNSVSASGICLHTGLAVNMVLRPAPANTGIVFRRVDLDPIVSIPAKVENVTAVVRCTTLGNSDGVTVSTVEHLLSALRGVGIDNMLVDLDQPELPVMDGSASPFLFLIESAGIEELPVPRKFIRIKRTVKVKDDSGWAALKPAKNMLFTYTTVFPDNHPVLSKFSNTVHFDLSRSSYAKDIGRARTFGKMSEFESLQKAGLAKGANMMNAVAIGDYRVLNEGGVRYDDELARHKLLDSIGDMSLLDGWLIGHFTGHKSGHRLNRDLMKKLLQSKHCWEWIKVPEGSREFVPLANQ